MRLVFMGTPDFSVPTLRALHVAGHEIAAVYTRAPAASGRRGRELRPSPVHAAADELGIAVRTPKTLRSNEEAAAFRDLKADAAVVIAYGRILPPAILDAVPFGCWNAHASLLPRWRGAAPIQRAIMAGDEETGVQVMRMEEGLDTGPIALTHREPIGPTTTAGDLFAVLADRAAKLMVEMMARLEAGTLETEPQGEDGVTYADKIEKGETRIDWTRPASEVARHINGLSPFPGAWTMLGEERVKLLRAEAGKVHYSPLDAEARRRLDVGYVDLSQAGQRMGDGFMPPNVLVGDNQHGSWPVVYLHEVQRAGRRPVSGVEFARGLADGARFE